MKKHCWQSHTEDKKCRICGYADPKNVNIFSDGNEVILQKISTVYPIVLYASDPLPKNICKKCVCNVGYMYNDMERVMRTQNKWITNVRNVQPEHNYIKILDLIEHTCKETKNKIDKLADKISKPILNRLLLLQKPATKFKQTKQSFQLDEYTEDDKAPIVDGGINNIKTILAQNGCSLLSVSTPTNHNTRTTTNECGRNQKDPLALVLPIGKTKKINKNIPIKCPYCLLIFDSVENLAKHQKQHLSVNLTNILQKKNLGKSMRRGRLITINDKKYIRCLNCWSVFGDNLTILDHWSEGECDYYCQLCGEEFIQTPKQLREHVTKTHDISWRNLKIIRQKIKIKTCQETNNEGNHLKSKSCEPKSSAKANLDAMTFCTICLKQFQNFKARNSHMRKHKPAYAFGDFASPLKSTRDDYMRIEECASKGDAIKIKIEPSDADNSTLTTTCTKATNIATPQPTSSTTSLRGVRTKFVKRRNEINLPTSNSNVTTPSIKLKTVESAQHNTPSTATASLTVIKEEPMDIDHSINIAPCTSSCAPTLSSLSFDYFG